MVLLNPDLTRLTSSNDTPSPTEAALVQQYIDDMLDQALELKGQLDELESRIQECKPILSPIRRLPPEILGEIFVVIPSADTLHFFDFLEVATVVSLVCKAWRSAAILVPTLWRKILVDPRKDVSFEAMHAWSSRAGRLPKILDLSTWDELAYLQTEERERPCLGSLKCVFSNPIYAKMLVEGSESWDELSIHCATHECFQNFATSVENFHALHSGSPRMSQVRKFTLSAEKWTHWRNTPHSTFSFLLPFSITSLSLYLPAVERLPPDQAWRVEVNVPAELLGRLISLRMSCSLPGPHIFTILQHCVALQTLYLDFEHAEIRWQPNDPLLQQLRQSGLLLPGLRDCRLYQVNSFTAHVLEILRMPSLHKLDLDFGKEDDDLLSLIAPSMGLPNFSGLVRGDLNSVSTLRSLRINGPQFEEDTLFQILRGLDGLIHLTLSYAQVPSNIFFKLSNPKKCLPALQLLKLDTVFIAGSHELAHLPEFVEERGACLTMNAVYPCPD